MLFRLVPLKKKKISNIISYRNRPCNHRGGTYPGLSALLSLESNSPDSPKPPPAAWPDPRDPQKPPQHPWASWHVGQPACSSWSHLPALAHVLAHKKLRENTAGLGRRTEGEHLHSTAVRFARGEHIPQPQLVTPSPTAGALEDIITSEKSHTTICSIQ